MTCPTISSTKMHTLHIDIETYSSADLKTCGVYRYTQAEDFAVLLFSYKKDDDEIVCVDIAQGDALPAKIFEALTDPDVLKLAHNAAFERVCIGALLGRQLDPMQWRCTMVHAALVGLPASLDAVANALDLEERKDKAGPFLINYFSKPCVPTAHNGWRRRNLPHHDPDKWALYKAYNIQDVATESAIEDALERLYPFPESIQEQYAIDQLINDYGVLVDLTLVDQINVYYDGHKEAYQREAVALTGLDNPQSLIQLKKWIAQQGCQVGSLAAKNVELLLDDPDLPSHVKRALELRQELSMTSTKKYDKIPEMVTDDGRVHGTFQFYGANRTGRWAGRLLQPHNFPRNYLKHIALIRDVIKAGHAEDLEPLYDSMGDVFKQLTRTICIAPKHRTFIISDYSAIEARVLAWLAQETWAIEVFNGDGRIYEGTYAKMFGVPIDSVTKSQRQRGKVATLALGYQGGPPAMIRMGALENGLTETELPEIVSAWRRANAQIVGLWYSVEQKAKRALLRPNHAYRLHDTPGLPRVVFTYTDGNLLIILPSDRRLSYFAAGLHPGERGSKIVYKGVNQQTRGWGDQDTYGGKLVENIAQAIARDVLAEALQRVWKAYPSIVLHVHDEIVVEVMKADEISALAEIKELMSVSPKWAPDLKLPAAAFASDFYKKD